jgi:hypothetical protein
MNGVFDQDNITKDSPLKNNVGVSVTNQKIETPYKFPYHGKAASASESLSDVAERLGWSADLWDFTNDAPVLKTIKAE